jgi:putative effector of murein hydrolase LrgA (UPF0299 family)
MAPATVAGSITAMLLLFPNLFFSHLRINSVAAKNLLAFKFLKNIVIDLSVDVWHNYINQQKDIASLWIEQIKKKNKLI